MKQVTAYGKLNSRGEITFAGWRKLQNELRQLSGRNFTVCFKVLKSGKTGPMISYFEAVMLPAIQRAMQEGGTYLTTPQVREHLRGVIPYLQEHGYDLDYEDWVFVLGEIRVWAGQDLQLAFEHEIVLSNIKNTQ